MLRDIDNREGRQLLRRLLERADQGVNWSEGNTRRLALLRDLAGQVGCGAGQVVVGDGGVVETYGLIASLLAQFRLPADRVIDFLEQRARAWERSR